MKVLILTEGSEDIGLGHVSRCIAIYQALEKHKAKVELLVYGDYKAEALLKGINYRNLNWYDYWDEVKKN